MAKYDTSLDTVFAALADPTRRQVLEQLACGPMTVSDLAEPFDMALPSFMAHLRKLESGGLIETRKDGRIRTCAIRPAAFEPVSDWLGEQRAVWQSRLDRFDDYVMNLMKERENGTRPKD